MTINPAIVRIVDFSARHRWMIVIAGALLMLGAAAYDVTRFSIDADIEGLISEDLPWHQRELQLLHAFPQKGILVVVKAPTAENAEQATNALAETLSKNHDLFPAVQQLDSGDFFERNGLLYQAPDDVRKSAEGLARAQPFIAALASDPSVRGVMTALSSAVQGVRAGQIKLEQLAWPLSLTDQTLGDVLSGKPAKFSWQELLQGKPLPAKQRGTSSEFNPRLILPRFSPDKTRNKPFGGRLPIWTCKTSSARRLS